jgi:hypothetical protein
LSFTRPAGGFRHTIINGVLAHSGDIDMRQLPRRMV